MTDTIIHEPITEIVSNVALARAKFAALYQRACQALQDGYPVELRMTPKKNTRSLQANSCMWAHLADISKQVVWNGQKLSPEEWKIVLSASLRRQKVVPGIDGNFVVIGISTSKMGIREMSDMIELACSFGALHDVKFSADPRMTEKK